MSALSGLKHYFVNHVKGIGQSATNSYYFCYEHVTFTILN